MKAILLFDTNRRPEQLEFVTERASILLSAGDRVWVDITDTQAQRFSEQGISVLFQGAVDWIQLPAVGFDPAEGAPTPPPSLQAAAPTGNDRAYYLVQFIAPPDSDWVNAIVNLGAFYIQNMPITVFVFSMTASQSSAAAALPFVRWVGIYHPAYALHYILAGQEQSFTSTSISGMSISAASVPAISGGNIKVVLFDNVDFAAMQSQIEATGSTVVSGTGSGFLITANDAQIAAIMLLPGVQRIEPFNPPSLENDRARAITNVNQVSQPGTSGFLVNLNGAGEIAGIIDSGLDHGNFASLATIHPDIRGTAGNRRILAIINLNPGTPPATPVPDTVPHGTHVVGTVAGDGTASAGRIKGVAPASFIVFQGGPFGEVFPFWQAHYNGARVHSNSWGTAPPGGGPSNNDYNARSMTNEIDRFCYLYPENFVLFCSGNDERDLTGGADGSLDMDRLKFEYLAKNILTVGATENDRDNDGFQDTYRAFSTLVGRYSHAGFNTLAGGSSNGYTMSDNPNQMALFSSRGPVNYNPPGPAALGPTGRIKPDIVAPGTNIISMRSSLTPPTGTWQDPGTVNSSLYQIMHGTSMAAPHVAGAAILARQFYRTRFGLLRRLVLLEGVAPTVSPPPDFVDLPAAAPHVDGAIFAWVTPAAPPDTRRIVASVFSPGTIQLNPALIQLHNDVGNNPAPVLARTGDHALLLHRHGDGSLRLSKFQKNAAPPYNLSLDTGFDTDGIVNVSAGVNMNDDRLPAMVVSGNEAAVAWCESSSNDLSLRAFDVTDGSAQGAGPEVLGTVSRTSSHSYIVHNGTSYAAAWVNQSGSNHSALFRIVGQGAGPVTVKAGAAEIRTSHLAWDSRSNRFVVVWCEVDGTNGDSIKLRFLANDGSLQGNEVTAMTSPAGSSIRRPFVALHPSGGYILAWEDNAEGNHYDVYFTFLDDTGQPDASRIAQDPNDAATRRVVKVSETPQDTQGFAVSPAQDGAFIVWQSLDEANSNNLDVSMVKVTLEGAFFVQADPLAPLIHNGRYVNHALSDGNAITSLDMVSMAWAGGDYYLLRWENGVSSRLTMVKTNADGRKDDTFGANGSLQLSGNFLYRRCEMYWASSANYLACILSGGLGSPSVHLFDNVGHPLDGTKPGVAAFGAGGARQIEELGTSEISPQLGNIRLPPPDYGTIAVYGAGFPFGNTIKYAILNRFGNFVDSAGAAVASPTTMVAHTHPLGMIETARHGWFHFVPEESHSIAVWNQKIGLNGNSDVFINRFDPNGVAVGVPAAPARAPAILLPRPAGDNSDSVNAVVTPRPVGVGGPGDPVAIRSNSRQREYAVAWQYRADDPQPWEIHFSRLQRDGQVRPNPAAPAPPANNIRVIFPGLTDAAGNAIWPPVAGTDTHATHPQLVCNFTDTPWQPLPAGGAAINVWSQWSPGFGLAWLGQPVAGGNRTLYFTVLDENGNRALLDRTPPAAVPTAGITRITRPEVDVADFKLIWNGRIFRLTWTEIENGRIRHMHTAITRQGSLKVYEHPSAALLKATLINGATNINNTTLPNIPVPPITAANRNDGYGWGRVNLRQSLTPSQPVTLHVRDGDAVGQGRTVSYRFSLPPNTDLLRVTLTWNDPPGPLVVNNLNLRVTATATGQVFTGNNWQTAAGNGWRSRIFAAGHLLDTANTIEQVVISSPPSGEYLVEVIGHTVAVNSDYQFPAQPFALVFVGSGPEVRFGQQFSCEDIPFH